MISTSIVPFAATDGVDDDRHASRGRDRRLAGRHSRCRGGMDQRLVLNNATIGLKRINSHERAGVAASEFGEVIRHQNAHHKEEGKANDDRKLVLLGHHHASMRRGNSLN